MNIQPVNFTNLNHSAKPGFKKSNPSFGVRFDDSFVEFMDFFKQTGELTTKDISLFKSLDKNKALRNWTIGITNGWKYITALPVKFGKMKEQTNGAPVYELKDFNMEKIANFLNSHKNWMPNAVKEIDKEQKLLRNAGINYTGPEHTLSIDELEKFLNI